MDIRDPDQTLILRPDVVVTALEGGAVLLDLKTKYFYSVNESGWAITQLFETGTTPADVRNRSTAWGANGSLDSVNAFVERMVAEGLLTSGAQPATPPQSDFTGKWTAPSLEKHKEPLQRVMISAFDPTLPLAE
jgi:hypothetical protein